MKLTAIALRLVSNAHDHKPHTAASRQWVIEQLCQFAPDIRGQILPGDGNHLPIPLTISGIQEHPESGLYIRITSLVDNLSEILCKWLANPLPDILTLDDVSYTIVETVRQNDSLAIYSTSYENLLRESINGSPSRRFHLEFVTPTVFRQGRFDMPLPEPFLIFQSLAQRWAFFSQTEFPFEMDFVREAIYISYHNIRTRRYHEPTRSTGFIGKVEFRVISRRNLPSPVRANYQHYRNLLNALCHYAEFAGVGARTMFGCGQVRIAK